MYVSKMNKKSIAGEELVILERFTILCSTWTMINQCPLFLMQSNITKSVFIHYRYFSVISPIWILKSTKGRKLFLIIS